MKIDIQANDRYGNALEIGDVVELFDWGWHPDGQKSLGRVRLEWDNNEGRVSCAPAVVDDAYDFWTKAIPRCVKLGAEKGASVG